MEIPKALQEPWNNLPEKQKKQFSLAIYGDIPRAFDVWARKAGLATGFRIQKVAARQVQPDRLDKVFFTIRDGTFATEMLEYYFKASNNVLHIKGLEILSGISRDEPECISRVLEILKGECLNDPWIGTYVGLAELKGTDWFGSQGEADTKEVAAAVLPLSGELTSCLSELHSCVEAIRGDLQSIETAKEVNKEEILDRIDKVFRLGEDFRRKFKSVSEAMNDRSNEWNSFEELQHAVGEFEELMVIRDKEGASREWVQELAAFLKVCSVEHRRLQKRQELKNLLNCAITEMEKQFPEQGPIIIPGIEGKDQRAWTKWMLGLEGKQFDTVLTQLSQSLPSLAEFFGEITEENLLLRDVEEESGAPSKTGPDTERQEGIERESKMVSPPKEVLGEEQVGVHEPDGETLDRITEEPVQAGRVEEATDETEPISDTKTVGVAEDTLESYREEGSTDPARALASKIRELSRRGEYLPSAMLASSLKIGYPTHSWDGPDFESLLYAYRSLDGTKGDSAPEWVTDPESCKAAPVDSARLTFLIAIYRSMLGDASVCWYFHETAKIFLSMFKEWPDLRAWLECAWHVSSEAGLWDMLRQGEKGETLAKELDRQILEFQKLYSDSLLHKVPKGAYSNRVRYIISMSDEMQLLSKYLKTLSRTAMGKDGLSKITTYLRRKPKTFMDDWFERIGKSLNLTDYQENEILEDVTAYLDTALQAFKSAETKGHLEQEKGERLAKIREYRETLDSRAQNAVSQSQGNPWEEAIRTTAKEALSK